MIKFTSKNIDKDLLIRNFQKLKVRLSRFLANNLENYKDIAPIVTRSHKKQGGSLKYSIFLRLSSTF
jgi:hypothetical protein